MKIYVRRTKLFDQTCFEIVYPKPITRVIASPNFIVALLEEGHEVKDIDAILAEASRWN